MASHSTRRFSINIDEDLGLRSNIEFVPNNYHKTRRNSDGCIKGDCKSLIYHTSDADKFDIDISITELYHKIKNEVPEDPISKLAIGSGYQSAYEKNIAGNAIGIGDGRQLVKGLQLNEILPFELIDLSGSENIEWTGLTLIQIIQLQAVGLFDRYTVASSNDSHKPFFKSSYPLLLIKIKAPCVFFSNEIPNMGRGMDDLSTFTRENVLNFNKWSISDIKSPEIRVWYSLQNTNTNELFIGDKFIEQENIQIRFWHEGGLLYSTQFNADLILKIPTVVKISGHTIAKNILKLNDPDSWVFSASHKLSDISFNKIVTALLGHLHQAVDEITKKVIKNNPRLKEKAIAPLLLTALLNFNYETDELDELLTNEDIIDPIIRRNTIRKIQATLIGSLKKELVSAKKDGNINLILIKKILNDIPIGLENTTNLLSNYFDTI